MDFSIYRETKATNTKYIFSFGDMGQNVGMDRHPDLGDYGISYGIVVPSTKWKTLRDALISWSRGYDTTSYEDYDPKDKYKSNRPEVNPRKFEFFKFTRRRLTARLAI